MVEDKRAGGGERFFHTVVVGALRQHKLGQDASITNIAWVLDTANRTLVDVELGEEDRLHEAHLVTPLFYTFFHHIKGN